MDSISRQVSMRLFAIFILLFGSILLMAVHFMDSFSFYRSALFGLAPWYLGFAIAAFWWVYKRLIKRRSSFISVFFAANAILQVTLLVSRFPNI